MVWKIDYDNKTCLISAIITGILTALTTKFPGGQTPNLLDKINTAIFNSSTTYLYYKLLCKYVLYNIVNLSLKRSFRI